MSYLAGVKKEDLRSLCEDLGLTITSKMSVLDLKNLIINDTKYDEEFTREHLKGIIQHRKSDYEQKLREIESERAFELEKLRLSQPQQSATTHGLGVEKPTLDVQKNQQWFFADMPQKQFAFGEHANDQHPVDNLDVNLCTLREEEGRCLNTTQKEKLVAVLKK
ncbi:retrovirus-related Pol polyprotein from transposon 17.6 [Nephila pilipes]|uniref:Retrovirus-related Pol polyprotein from transposon 17.6 n=1 Tax=Nephila pilipes TaxID=299642 RepID=A0A8X6N9B6_NEPPI|nr:retrovirus-related Pol polyprotein from transposon 17.6 [Nephila pilipes]